MKDRNLNVNDIEQLFSGETDKQVKNKIKASAYY